MKAIKHECHDWGYSVMVDTLKGFNVWFDLEVKDDEVTESDWNQYIFYVDSEDDMMRDEFQKDLDNFIEVDCAAIDYLYKTILKNG